MLNHASRSTIVQPAQSLASNKFSMKRAAPGRLKLHLEYGADEDGMDGMADSERTVSRAARASMGERVQIAE